MDEKICIGCKYSEAYQGFPIVNGKFSTVLKCHVLSSVAPEPCECISACPFVPKTGRDPAYLTLMKTELLDLTKNINMAKHILDETVFLEDSYYGRYVLGKEIKNMKNYERELTSRLIKAMRWEEEKKNE